MNTIDAIIYINLDHRKDREESILNELKLFDVPAEKIHRIAGIYNKECGHIGCGQAHINALNLAVEKGWDRVLILEDDFYFKITLEDFNTFIHTCDKVVWDVLLLSAGRLISDMADGVIRKVISCTTTAGYIVKKSYYKTLLDKFNDSLLKMNIQLEDHIKKYAVSSEPVPKLIHGVYAIDKAWKELQSKDSFYIGEPVAGRQGRHTSDTF
jgi:GR25 family glycosyltransferase involved in LPS biosynthesis